KLYHIDSSLKLPDLISKVDNFENEDEDYSNTMGTEKIIFLQQLGILDYLKKQEPFNLSTNAMAKALSAITGIPTSTVSSYLQPMYSPENEQKNNPLSRFKKVEKVKRTLSNI